MLELHLTRHLRQRNGVGGILHDWFSIQHFKDALTAGARAHEPGNHKAKGAYRRAQQQRILNDRTRVRRLRL